MKATINKIRSGKYTARHHGYVFIIDNQSANVWTISNHFGVEVYKDTSKKALTNMISSYGFDGTMKLHQQQVCQYS